MVSSSGIAILFSKKLEEYDLGHVLTKNRYKRFWQLFNRKIGRKDGLEVVEPGYAERTDLELVHTPKYLDRIERLEPRDPLDTPLSPEIIRGAKLMAGAGKLAGELVYTGKYQKAIAIGGGVQHANRNQEKGFGVFSDVGVCAENLLLHHGAKRILIVDLDAHCGEGVYQIFSSDPRVLHISVHQDTHTVFPGPRWGLIEQVGQGKGEGYSVNIPLLPGSGDQEYQDVLDQIIQPLAQEFRPEIILMIDGSDTHFTDQITQMGMSLKGLRSNSHKVKQIADQVCEGRVIDFAGSGYSAIAPLGWIASLSGLAGLPLKLQESQSFPQSLSDKNLRQKIRAETKQTVVQVKAVLKEYWKGFR